MLRCSPKIWHTERFCLGHKRQTGTQRSQTGARNRGRICAIFRPVPHDLNINGNRAPSRRPRRPARSTTPQQGRGPAGGQGEETKTSGQTPGPQAKTQATRPDPQARAGGAAGEENIYRPRPVKGIGTFGPFGPRPARGSKHNKTQLSYKGSGAHLFFTHVGRHAGTLRHNY